MQRWAQIKDRNGMDLTEPEDMKKKWQEYTEELYRKDIMVWSRARHPGMQSHMGLRKHHCEQS